MGLKIAVVYGSVREAREGIRAALFISKQLEKRGHKVILIDPVLFDLPMIDKTYGEYPKGKAPKALENLARVFRGADGVMIVTAEYNHLPPPALLNLLNHFMKEYFFKPSAILSYSSGSYGGVRAAVQMRDFLAEVGMGSIPTNFAIGKVQESISEKGLAVDKAYNKRVKKFLDEFEWYAKAMKTARKKGVPY